MFGPAGGSRVARLPMLLVPTASDLRSRSLTPVSGASLAAYRAAFGVTVFVEVLRYVGYGWVHDYYVEPAIRLTYWGWGWVPSAPPAVIGGVFVALGAAGLALAAGWRTRWAAGAVTLLLGYVFLLEQGRYLNHIYLMVTMAALLALLPAGRAWSLDARRRSGRWRGDVPAWAVWAVRAHLGVVYVYAAVAKLNPDWLRGEPIGTWLSPTLATSPLAFVTDLPNWELLFAWGGLALDGLALPLLLWRRTRVAVALALVGFHLFNAWAFSIGVFPWLMIAVLPIFFAPDWPERLWERLRGAPAVGALNVSWTADDGRRTANASPDVVAPAVGAEPSGTEGDAGMDPASTAAGAPAVRGPGPALRADGSLAPRPLTAALLACFFAVQLMLPLRHWLTPGDVAWTEEGHTYSWRMKLRSKHATAARFHVVADGDTTTVWPRDVLVDWQARKVPTRPDLVLQVAHRLAADARADGAEAVSVYASIEVQLNDRPPQLFVDPAVDLAAEPRSLRKKHWIVPLDRAGRGPRLDDLGNGP